jgi:peptide chain release factor
VISGDKWQQLKERMEALGIREDELQEQFILGSGHGGQKIQKTSSTVHLKHEPTGIVIKCQQSRQRDDNRFHARRLLCEKIEEQVLQKKSKRQQEMEKIRRQKQRRSRRSQQKMLDEKTKRGDVKKLRKPPKNET